MLSSLVRPSPRRPARSVHERALPGPRSEVVRLMEGLGGPRDRLWPADRWPAMILDSGVAPGSEGGHGPIRYRVIAHRPGQQIHFAFDRAEGIEGHHRFIIGEGSTLRHELVVTRAPLGLMMAIMPMHDALLGDLLDQAVAAVAGRRIRRVPLSPAVRALRGLTG